MIDVPAVPRAEDDEIVIKDSRGLYSVIKKESLPVWLDHGWTAVDDGTSADHDGGPDKE